MAERLLSASEYKSLLRDIVSLRDQADSASSIAKVEAYWAMGRRIEKLRISEKAGYHNSVIRDLAADSGLAIRTLHQSVKFFEEYKSRPQDEELSWTHYRALLKLPTKAARDFYVEKVHKESWTSRQLEAAIQAGLHLGKKAKQRALARPGDPEYLYAAEVRDVIDGDTLDVDIDLGFGVGRKVRVRLAVIDCPPLSSEKGRKARNFVAAHLMKAKQVVLKTEKTDMYGRYVAHVFYTARKTSITSCFDNGDYLNALLVQEKLATVIG